MSLEAFETFRFQAKTLLIIEQTIAIIEEFLALGFVLTLRQLFYQFVSRALIENTQAEYKRLGTIIKNGRRAGLIDWDAIEDRTRNVRSRPSWESPADIIADAATQFQADLWRWQDFRPEVWIEKDALLGVIEGVCEEWRLPSFACRGNNSESEQRKAGKRFAALRAAGVTPIVFHLGDHDPNGIDMTRDNRDRLAMFARHDVEVRRLALNMDQVEHYRPPPNFAKETDTRFAAYAAKFGLECWELDALNPTVIANLIRNEVERMIDVAAWIQPRLGRRPSERGLATQAQIGPWSKISWMASDERRRHDFRQVGGRTQNSRYPNRRQGHVLSLACRQRQYCRVLGRRDI